MALNEVHESKFTPEELVNFARETMNHVQSLENTFIVHQCEILQGYIAEMDAAFQRVLKNSYSKKIAELDDRRDKLIIAIRTVVQGAIETGIIDPIKATAAQTIQVHLDNLSPNIIRLSYSEESSEINAFLTAMESIPEETLQTATVDTLIPSLAQAQTLFQRTVTRRDVSESDKSTPRQIRFIRKDISRRLDALLMYVDLYSDDFPDEFGSTAERLNTVIDSYMAKAKAKATRKEGDE